MFYSKFMTNIYNPLVKIGVVNTYTSQISSSLHVSHIIRKIWEESSGNSKYQIAKAWTEKQIPSSWKKSVLIKLPKKGDLKDCNHWDFTPKYSIQDIGQNSIR